MHKFIYYYHDNDISDILISAGRQQLRERRRQMSAVIQARCVGAGKRENEQNKNRPNSTQESCDLYRDAAVNKKHLENRHPSFRLEQFVYTTSCLVFHHHHHLIDDLKTSKVEKTRFMSA
jgi:hypothetical protein